MQSAILKMAIFCIYNIITSTKAKQTVWKSNYTNTDSSIKETFKKIDSRHSFHEESNVIKKSLRVAVANCDEEALN